MSQSGDKRRGSWLRKAFCFGYLKTTEKTENSVFSYQVKEDPVPSVQPPLAQPVFEASAGQPYCVVRSQTGRITEIVLRLDIRYLTSIPGILNIVLFVSSLITVNRTCSLRRAGGGGGFVPSIFLICTTIFFYLCTSIAWYPIITSSYGSSGSNSSSSSRSCLK